MKRFLSILLIALLVLSPLAQPTWAASDNDDTVIIDGITYHVLHNNDDWEHFRSLVEEAEGQKEVNAIMAEDFGVTSSVGSTDVPFKGTFDGNGHTLNLLILNSSTAYVAPFLAAKDFTIKNLHVTGAQDQPDRELPRVGHHQLLQRPRGRLHRSRTQNEQHHQQQPFRRNTHLQQKQFVWRCLRRMGRRWNAEQSDQLSGKRHLLWHQSYRILL